MIERVISGGQTGVDQAALRAARRLGIATGGTAPRGWRTLAGPAPWLADYGLVEHALEAYSPRTEANVREADATLRIALELSTPGERCTLRAIDKLKKSFADICLIRVCDGSLVVRCSRVLGQEYRGDDARWALVRWLAKPRVLNVAGNSEETAPGIGVVAERILVDLLAESRA